MLLNLLRRLGHGRWRALLSPYLDGRLTPVQGRRLEEHLATCDRCQRQLAELRATVELLRSLPQEEVPRSFVLTPAMVPAVAPTPPAYRMVPAGAAVAAVLLAFLLAADVSGLLQGGGTATGTTVTPQAQAERALAPAEKAAPAAIEDRAAAAVAPSPTPLAVPAPERAAAAPEEGASPLWRGLEAALAAALVGLAAGTVALWRRRRRAAM